MSSHFKPYKGDLPYIFVSYSHKDSRQVLPIISGLHKSGLRVWYDEGIEPGSEWREEIAGQLSGCSLFLLFMSPNAAVSKHVKREIFMADEEDRALFNVLLKETDLPPDLKYQLSSIQYMSYDQQNGENVDEFVNTLKEKILKKAPGTIEKAADAAGVGSGTSAGAAGVASLSVAVKAAIITGAAVIVAAFGIGIGAIIANSGGATPPPETPTTEQAAIAATPTAQPTTPPPEDTPEPEPDSSPDPFEELYHANDNTGDWVLLAVNWEDNTSTIFERDKDSEVWTMTSRHGYMRIVDPFFEIRYDTDTLWISFPTAANQNFYTLHRGGRGFSGDENITWEFSTDSNHTQSSDWGVNFTDDLYDTMTRTPYVVIRVHWNDGQESYFYRTDSNDSKPWTQTNRGGGGSSDVSVTFDYLSDYLSDEAGMTIDQSDTPYILRNDGTGSHGDENFSWSYDYYIK